MEANVTLMLCRVDYHPPIHRMKDWKYDLNCGKHQSGDRLLFFSDGAEEIHNAAGEMLGLDGLIGILKKQGYPTADIQMVALEEELLKYSNWNCLNDCQYWEVAGSWIQT
jgi:serine phosphatase RsbU (regulator of sigma subunit)